MLRDAYQLINHESTFHCSGQKNERLHLKRMLKILIQTRVGRSMIEDIGQLLKKRRSKKAVVLKLARLEDDVSALTDKDLLVKMKRIRMNNMTQRQQDKVLLMQSITLMHELVHIRQFLMNTEKTISSFSIPHQMYANIVEELAASLEEEAFKIELKKTFPFCKQMRLQNRPSGWRKTFAKSFFKFPLHFGVSVWIDQYARFFRTLDTIVLEDKAEQKAFCNWVNREFKKMALPFSYQDFALGKVTWAKKTQGDFLQIKSTNTLLLFDKKGRLVISGTGFEKGKEKRLQFSVFVYDSLKKNAQKWLNNVKRKYPHATIYAVVNKTQKFSDRQALGKNR